MGDYDAGHLDCIIGILTPQPYTNIRQSNGSPHLPFNAFIPPHHVLILTPL